jgi:hypothetical protein
MSMGTVGQLRASQVPDRSAQNPQPNPGRLLILLGFRHALRVSELVSLTVDQFDFLTAKRVELLTELAPAECVPQ